MSSIGAATLNSDFSFLDQQEIRAKFVTGPKQNLMRFYVGGIHCAKCVRRLEDLPNSVPGLRLLRIEIGKSLAHVEIDPDISSFSRVADEIAKLGFAPIPLEHENDLMAAERQEWRQELMRLAVAAACAGNIMTFAFASYFGAGVWEPLFRWLSFFVYLPVLTYVALPFYRGAWRSLKQRQVSIDLPMAVASLFGFVFSTVELLRGHEDIYFDSLSGFLFLILASRAVQKRMQRNYLRPQELLETLQLQRMRKLDSLNWSWTPVESVKPGDRVLLYAQETLAADAELQSSKAYFSLAWLSGESKSKTFLKGALVPAGARLIAGEAQLTIRKPLSETGFGKILEEVRKFSLSKNRIVLTSDRWAQYLLATVFSVAAAFLFYYWQISPEAAIQRSLALIILACPCAMAFGAPLALAVSLRRAQKAGLIIRDANIFEKAKHIKTVFFDKTGTLTETDLQYVGDPGAVAPVFQKIVLSLENESLHPIAFAFRKAFADRGNLPPVDSLTETPGMGVAGYIYGKQYEIKKNSTVSQEISCTLFEDGAPRMRFQFETKAKADCAQTLDNLRAKGYKIKLLSGDGKLAVESLARQLGFDEEDVHHSASPTDKERIVAATPNSMMVGDGINDSLAMLRADVGLAVSGGMETALNSAQAYLAEDGVHGVETLLNTSAEAFALIRQNLILSAAYNLIGGTLALMGFVNPLVAAVLMPISSGFILFSTWLRARR